MADSLAQAPKANTTPRKRPVPREKTPRPAPAFPIDLDHAGAAELELLPRIGPALAARIVADRAAKGPFGSLEALEKRVRGIGPAMAKALSPLVTFSGR
jgi:competence protein ComEA